MVETTWLDFYRVAILELDRSLHKVRLTAAEDAINARASDARASREERRQMADALSTLHRLKRVDRRLVPNTVESARELHLARAFSVSLQSKLSVFPMSDYATYHASGLTSDVPGAIPRDLSTTRQRERAAHSRMERLRLELTRARPALQHSPRVAASRWDLSTLSNAHRWRTSGIERPQTARIENSTRPPTPVPVASLSSRCRDPLRSPRAAEWACRCS